MKLFPDQRTSAAAKVFGTQLNTISVWSNPAGSWQLVNQYNLAYYDYATEWGQLVWADKIETTLSVCSQNVIGPNYCAPKLTLKSIPRVGSDGITGLPATRFTYGHWVDTAVLQLLHKHPL